MIREYGDIQGMLGIENHRVTVMFNETTSYEYILRSENNCFTGFQLSDTVMVIIFIGLRRWIGTLLFLKPLKLLQPIYALSLKPLDFLPP